jgi:hypothetical protein
MAVRCDVAMIFFLSSEMNSDFVAMMFIAYNDRATYAEIDEPYRSPLSLFQWI